MSQQRRLLINRISAVLHVSLFQEAEDLWAVVEEGVVAPGAEAVAVEVLAVVDVDEVVARMEALEAMAPRTGATVGDGTRATEMPQHSGLAMKRGAMDRKAGTAMVPMQDGI
jgi:hypothetical protein